jgi:hypothetical protein
MNKFEENDIVITNDYNLAVIRKVIKQYAENTEKEQLEKRILAYRKAISFEDMKYVNSKLSGVWNTTHLNKCRRILKLLERDISKLKDKVPVYFYEICYGADHQIMTVVENTLFEIKNKQCFNIERKTYGKKDK